MDPENNISCPICEEEFVDMRGLTSHARHKHQLEKEELFELYDDDPEEDSIGWKILGGLGAFALALITLGKFR